MPNEKEREFLTESHRIIYELEKTKLLGYLAFFFIGIGLVYMIISIGQDMFMSDEDKQTLKKIAEYRAQAVELYRQKKVGGVPYYEYLDKLNKKEQEIKDQYTKVIFTLNIFKAIKQGKTIGYKIFVLFSVFLPILMASGMYFYMRKKFKEHSENFFFRTPQQEDPLGLEKEIKIRLFLADKDYEELSKQLFSDIDTFMRVMQFALKGCDEKKAAASIKKVMNTVEEFMKMYYPTLLTKENLLRIEIVLWHYVAGLYGNAPTGLVGKFLKDYTVRKMLVLYHRKHLPVLFDVVEGQFLEKDYMVYLLLKVIYDCDKKYSIFTTLKKELDPLPF